MKLRSYGYIEAPSIKAINDTQIPLEKPTFVASLSVVFSVLEHKDRIGYFIENGYPARDRVRSQTVHKLETFTALVLVGFSHLVQMFFGYSEPMIEDH